MLSHKSSNSSLRLTNPLKSQPSTDLTAALAVEGAVGQDRPDRPEQLLIGTRTIRTTFSRNRPKLMSAVGRIVALAPLPAELRSIVLYPWTYVNSFRGIVSPKCVSKETLGWRSLV